jgi:hypothetical protein
MGNRTTDLNSIMGAGMAVNVIVVEGQIKGPIELEKGPYGIKGRFKLRIRVGPSVLDIPCQCVGQTAQRVAMTPRPYPRAVVAGCVIPLGGTGPQDPIHLGILAESVVPGPREAEQTKEAPGG